MRRPLFDIIWHGAIVGFVVPWSHTRGELLAPRLQAIRPIGADPLEDADLAPPDDDVAEASGNGRGSHDGGTRARVRGDVDCA